MPGNTNIDKNKIWDFGGGSSFEGLKSVKSKEKYMKRFMSLKDEKNFISIFKDKELKELSNEIFGHIKNSELIYSRPYIR